MPSILDGVAVRTAGMALLAGIAFGTLITTAPAAAASSAMSQSATWHAAVPASPDEPDAPRTPTSPSSDETAVSVSVPGEPSRVLQIILLVTVLGVGPAILLLCTSFTKIVVVLSLTRSALGTPTIPPNQVLVGLALFLSLIHI